MRVKWNGRHGSRFCENRIGHFSRVGCALFNDQASGYDRARAVANDAFRGLTLTGIGSGVRAVAKGIGKAISKARASRGGNTVIGKVDDLAPNNLRPGERTLLDKLPHQGNPRANWKQNSSVLRTEIRKNRPIRDASSHLPDNHPKVRGSFLGAERNLLKNQGWTFDRSTGFWNPPK